jgi:hypothetical protein
MNTCHRRTPARTLPYAGLEATISSKPTSYHLFKLSLRELITYYAKQGLVIYRFTVTSSKSNIMSKDKGAKNVKKAPSTEGKKASSDYQSGKKTTSTTDSGAGAKKK